MKIELSVICITIISVSLLSGCVNPPTESNYYYYSINIIAQQPFNYTVYAPIAYEYGSNFSMEEIVLFIQIIQGAGHFKITWTEYGPALEITSNDTIHLVSEYQDQDNYHPLDLSMVNRRIDNDIKEHWLFCDADEQGELEVNITLRAEAGECCGEVRTEETKPEFQTISCDGWQKITTLYTILE